MGCKWWHIKILDTIIPAFAVIYRYISKVIIILMNDVMRDHMIRSGSISYSILHKMSILICHALFYCGHAILMNTCYASVILDNSCNVFSHILQGCFTDTGAIVWLPPQYQWSNPEGYGWNIDQYLSTTKHNKTWTIHIILGMYYVNTLRSRQNWCHFTNGIFIFRGIFLNENVWILIQIALKFVARGPINNISSLVQKMARCRPGNKPLS